MVGFERGKLKFPSVELDREKSRALRDVKTRAQSLRRGLLGMKRDIDIALERVDRGEGFGGYFGFGPVGHQSPFDVATESARLDAAVNTAYMLGATQEEISAAYAEGAKGDR